MNTPSSSGSLPDLTQVSERENAKNVGKCQVCDRDGHGKHFGAITCRACAAFFRRSGIANNFKPCKKKGKCSFSRSDGWFSCKACRLKKCKELGMNSENFQYDRDVHHSEKSKPVKLYQKIPQSMDTFLGRSNLIIYCAPPPNSFCTKPVIDVQFLIDRAQKILKEGPATPILIPNCLEKLAMGLNSIRGTTSKGDVKILTRLGREEIFALWEDDMLKVAKWFSYFDEFQRLPESLQLDMLKGVWNVFGRLEKLATTAIARQQKLCGESMLMTYIKKDEVMCDIKNVDVDLSWCSRYTFEQLKMFDSHDHEKQLDILVKLILDLQPTDVELSYMLCQLCFHQVGKKHQGALQEMTDRFQETLSNHLHDYYVNSMRQSKYAGRIASMMKINNTIQQCIYRDSVKSELYKVFDVFYVECSHPDLFKNC